MSRGVLVLGMHRSGTSLTASLISAWGAYAGEHHLIPGDTWNPAGYWEYLPLVRLNMDLLNAVGARTMIPPPTQSRSNSPGWLPPNSSGSAPSRLSRRCTVHSSPGSGKIPECRSFFRSGNPSSAKRPM